MENLLTTDQRIFLDVLSHTLCGVLSDIGHDDIDWSSIYDISVRQGCVSLVGEFINRNVKKICIPRPVLYKWIAAIENRRVVNEKKKLLAGELQALLGLYYIRVVTLKGFSFAQYYDVPDFRESGDFDFYLFGEYLKANSILKSQGIFVDESFYVHSHINYKGLICENHIRLLGAREGDMQNRLNSYLLGLLHTQRLEKIHNSVLFSPSLEFNIKYQIAHTFSHFLRENISIRHICDWFYIISKNQNKINWDDFYSYCKEYGFYTFVLSLNDICLHYLGLNWYDSSPILYDSNYSERILVSIFNTKKKDSSKNKWYSRLLQVKYILFYNRWKFRCFTDMSALLYTLRRIGYFILKKEV